VDNRTLDGALVLRYANLGDRDVQRAVSLLAAAIGSDRAPHPTTTAIGPALR